MRTIRHHFPVLFYATALLTAIAIVFCFQLLVAQGTSMEPTFYSGDLLLKTFPYREPQVGDVVVIEHKGVLMVKRVAAVAGQTALAPDAQSLQSNTISGNAVHYEQLGTDDYLRGLDLWGEHTYWCLYNYWNTNGSCTVPEDYIFVVGDNLSKSYDSRYEDFGLISTDQVKGYIMFRLLEGPESN